MRWWWSAAAMLVAAATAEAGERHAEILYFRGHDAPVRVVRGAGTPAAAALQTVPVPGAPTAAERGAVAAAVRCRGGSQAACAGIETVSFGDGRGETVTIVRGAVAAPAAEAAGRVAATGRVAPAGRVETVRFADPALAGVTIVRGTALVPGGLGLFSPRGGELDRIAFAVEGVESGHGTNPAMWRAEAQGPQGPMQVSAAAALDVGGGDRFDVRQNRALGRAFLARLYQRYGNWPDALAAYDWGPANLDAWIAGGRPEDRLPLETARYIEMVLRDAVLGKLRL